MAKLLLTILFSLFLIQSYAQNSCSCPQWNEKEKSNNNPLLLINAKIVFCQAKGYELIAADFLAKNEGDSTAYYIKKAEALYYYPFIKYGQDIIL
jgi:putative hemolysin